MTVEHSFFEHNTAVSVAQWPCSRTTRLTLVGMLFEYLIIVFVCVGTCTLHGGLTWCGLQRCSGWAARRRGRDRLWVRLTDADGRAASCRVVHDGRG